MLRRRGPFFAIMGILGAVGCSARSVDAPEGRPGGACRDGDDPCDPGAACSESSVCYDQASPCDGYDCGAGACTVVDDGPFCECPAGTIHASASAPCRETTASDSEPPGQPGGLCLAPDGFCDRGTCNRDMNYCYLPEDPCVGFACGGLDRGRCEPSGGQPSCLCFEGFDNEAFALYCCPLDGSDPVCQ